MNPALIERYEKDVNCLLMARSCFTLGCRNKSEFLDLFGRTLIKLKAPYPAAGVVFDGRARGVLRNKLQPVLHAGTSSLMPVRFQCAQQPPRSPARAPSPARALPTHSHMNIWSTPRSANTMRLYAY